MRYFRILCILCVCCLLSCVSTHAQDNPAFEIGLKPYGSYHGGNIDTVSLGNGSLAVDIPIISYPQRGGKLKLDFSLHYFNWAYTASQTCFPPPANRCVWIPNLTVGGMALIENGSVLETVTPAQSLANALLYVVQPDGAAHILGATGTNAMESVDATAYHATWNPNNTRSCCTT